MERVAAQKEGVVALHRRIENSLAFVAFHFSNDWKIWIFVQN
jgi:hypothetical protein